MLKLARWSTTHRRHVLLAWVVLAIATIALGRAAAASYSNNFTLPHSDAQRASDLLKTSFPSQAGDRDQIVFHTPAGTVLTEPVRRRVTAMLGEVARPQIILSLNLEGRQVVKR